MSLLSVLLQPPLLFYHLCLFYHNFFLFLDFHLDHFHWAREIFR